LAKSLDVTLRLAGSRFDNVLATKLTVAPGNPGLGVWAAEEGKSLTLN
jgi:hypothetical protein